MSKYMVWYRRLAWWFQSKYAIGSLKGIDLFYYEKWTIKMHGDFSTHKAPMRLKSKAHFQSPVGRSQYISSKNYLKRCGTRKNEKLHQKLHLHNLFNSSKKDFNTTKNTRRTLIKNTTQKSQFGYLSSENFWSKFYTEKSLV